MIQDNLTYSYLPPATDIVTLLSAMAKLTHKQESAGSFGFDDGSNLILPKPETSLHYVYFFINEVGGLGYNELGVDTLSSLNCGCGVDSFIPVAKRDVAIAYLKHANRKDYWIITKPFFSNQFKAYLFTKNGIQSPVLSTVGRAISPIANSKAIFKGSPTGGTLAFKLSTVDAYQMYSVNLNTGHVTGIQKIDSLGAHALTFSEVSPKVFITKRTPALTHSIVAIDIQNGISKRMAQTAVEIGVTSTTSPITNLRLSADSKMLVATAASTAYGTVVKNTFTENNYSKFTLPASCGCGTEDQNRLTHLTGRDQFYLSEYIAYNTLFFNTSLTTLPSNSHVLMTLKRNTNQELILNFSHPETNYNFGISLHTNNGETIDFNTVKGFQDLQFDFDHFVEVGYQRTFEIDAITKDDQLVHLNGTSTIPIGTIAQDVCRLLEEDDFHLLDEQDNMLDLEACDFVELVDSDLILQEYNYKILTENGEQLEIE